jgi:multidrug resistance efflux pump
MNNIFRNMAVEQALSPRELNKYIKIITPPFMIIFVALLLIAATIIIWGISATIPIRIELPGIVFPQNGILTIVANNEGAVFNVRVKPGDYVEEGDIIAYIPHENILHQIKDSSDAAEKGLLRLEYHAKSMILSPTDGMVISIASEGDYLQVGKEIARLVSEDIYTNNQEVTAFASYNEGKKLKKGMSVQISPHFAPREEYGYMEGVITRIANIPSTRGDTIKRFGGFISEKDLDEHDSNIEVKITIFADSGPKSHLKWSNQKGEALEIDAGTKCNIAVLINRIRPIDLLLGSGKTS